MILAGEKRPCMDEQNDGSSSQRRRKTGVTPKTAALRKAEIQTGQSTLVHDQFPTMGLRIVAQDVFRPVLSQHLEVTMIRRQPRIEDGGHRNAPAVHANHPRFLLSLIPSMALDDHVHAINVHILCQSGKMNA